MSKTFKDLTQEQVDRHNAGLAKLGIDPDQACFFAMGSLRPDKKILELIEVFTERKETLLIAGRGWNEYVDDVKNAAAQADNVHLFAQWVEAEDASLRK